MNETFTQCPEMQLKPCILCFAEKSKAAFGKMSQQTILSRRAIHSAEWTVSIMKSISTPFHEHY